MPAQPLVSSVTIDGDKFDAESVSVGFTTLSNVHGLPMMGTLHTAIEVVVDIHDTENVPYATLSNLFDLAKVVTRDKIKEIKIEFWKDEKREDVICTYTLTGWINHFQMHSAGGSSHTLVLSIQPTLDPQSYPVIDMSN